MPGISPFERFIRPPMRSMSTSSCSSINFCARLPGMNAPTWMLFLINCTLQHLRIAELGWRASFWNFEMTIPRACDAPSNGSAFSRKPSMRFLYAFCRHLNLRLFFSSFRAFMSPILTRRKTGFLNVESLKSRRIV